MGYTTVHRTTGEIARLTWNMLKLFVRSTFRFKFADKNGTAGWGLRLRVPPSIPAITVPSRSLSDQSLTQCLLENDRLKNVKFFIPPTRNQKLQCPEEIRTVPTSGLNNLHVDRSALSLPKGISATGHNVSCCVHLVSSAGIARKS